MRTIQSRGGLEYLNFTQLLIKTPFPTTQAKKCSSKTILASKQIYNHKSHQFSHRNLPSVISLFNIKQTPKKEDTEEEDMRAEYRYHIYCYSRNKHIYVAI